MVEYPKDLEERWKNNKSVIANNIKETMDLGMVDTETLSIMLELLDRIKIRKRMTDFVD